MNEKEPINRRLENIDKDTKPVQDWRFYDIDTPLPYMSMIMIGADGKKYRVWANISQVTEIQEGN